ncbi:hydrolase [Aeromonas caviae]|uniref:Hydrolase n=12 Tax=Aeromonas TaxID=642 RepID=A0A6S4TWS6_AERCA|nr:hydrolase [Aeromonas caviae]
MQITLPGRKRRILICRRPRARTLVATDQPLFLSNRTSPMTAQGHLLFSVTCVLLAHKVGLTPALADASLWHIVPMALASALLPDLDHPRSLLGRQLPWISGPLSRLFGHRGFTHSLLAVGMGVWGLAQVEAPWLLSGAVKDALIVGYLSHLLGDWLTPMGIPLLWPWRRRFRLPGLPLKSGGGYERAFCLLTLALAGYWVHGGAGLAHF